MGFEYGHELPIDKTNFVGVLLIKDALRSRKISFRVMSNMDQEKFATHFLSKQHELHLLATYAYERALS